MRITMIGHASLFVETNSVNILFDPVLFDPHQEGLLSIYPARTLSIEAIPTYDMLIISHRHLDHFDVMSLNVLPKEVTVVIPQDELVERTLRDLGYSDIRKVNDFTEISYDDLYILFTRSENRVPEHGVVLRDESGVFWNQVDSVVSPRTVQRVLEMVHHVDFLLASWQPMLETNCQTNGSLAFPANAYSEKLRLLGMLEPAALAPGANAFKYDGDSEWLNSVVFPVSRERFLEDVKSATPHTVARKLDPGDILLMEGGRTTFIDQGASFVSMIDGSRELIRFNPISGDRRLLDRTSTDCLATKRDEVFAGIAAINRFISTHTTSFSYHKYWGVIYELDILCGDHWLPFSCIFGLQDGELRAGSDPLANMSTQITATSFVGLLDGTEGWDRALLGGFCRHYCTVYRPNQYGLQEADGGALANPLEIMLPYSVLFEKIIARQVSIAKQAKIPLGSETIAT